MIAGRPRVENPRCRRSSSELGDQRLKGDDPATNQGIKTSYTEIQHLASGVLPTIRDRGRIWVGFTTFYPRAMPDRDGTWIGYNIDIATRLAEDMGVELEFVPTAYEELNTALKNDPCPDSCISTGPHWYYCHQLLSTVLKSRSAMRQPSSVRTNLSSDSQKRVGSAVVTFPASTSICLCRYIIQ